MARETKKKSFVRKISRANVSPFCFFYTAVELAGFHLGGVEQGRHRPQVELQYFHVFVVVASLSFRRRRKHILLIYSFIMKASFILYALSHNNYFQKHLQNMMMCCFAQDLVYFKFLIAMNQSLQKCLTD